MTPPLRLLLLETSSTYDFTHPEEWSEALTLAFDEADVVIGTFSPHGPRILKGEDLVSVIEARSRGWVMDDGKRWVILQGSADPKVCAAQNDKLRRGY